MTTMTRVQTEYQLWLQDPAVDEQTKQELRAIRDDEREIEDRFYKDLEFGTGGLRGVIGAGTNRINVYTVGRASQGLASYVNGTGAANPAIVLAYDSRHMSPEFALEAALVFAGNGIKAYLFQTLHATPQLSFAVRYLGAAAGVVVTASHNPPEYNGYKVYGADGGQLVPEFAEQVIDLVQSIDSFDKVKKLSQEEAEAQGLLAWLGDDVDQAYIQAVTAISQNPDVIKEISDDFRVIFTPLHGAGNVPVREVLKAVGFGQVRVVAEQELPDPQFSTVKSPNPEEREAFTLAIAQAKDWNADIIIGTDPDADRMGAVVKDANGEYVVLTGNQSGAIIVNYLLSSMKERGTLPANGVVIKTIVTSELGAAVANHYGIPTLNTLTGFKYIGEKMSQFEKTGEHTFLFGYEESYGYLAGSYARDKDAVIAAMLIAEAAAFYKKQGKTLYEVLQGLYESFGYFLEKLESRTLKGKDGVEQIGRMVEAWRTNPPAEIGGTRVSSVEDYAQGIQDLPRENVLKFKLEDGSWFCLRPSGTEPKIKFYFAVQGATGPEAAKQLDSIIQYVLNRVDG
ncbi:phospho-sugar mutase [Paenibacillus pectinilyticus]